MNKESYHAIKREKVGVVVEASLHKPDCDWHFENKCL